MATTLLATKYPGTPISIIRVIAVGASFGRNTFHQRHGIFRFENLGLELPQSSVQTENRRLSGGDVNIAGALLHAGFQQFVDKNSSHTYIVLKFEIDLRYSFKRKMLRRKPR